MRLTTLFLAALACLVFVSGAYASGLKADSKQPIDITADSLEVLQEKQVAIFTGNVLAVQGKMRLSADTMKVHYKNGGESKSGEQGISKIEVIGKVYLSTPEESARGAKGTYDVDKERLTLTDSVVLTRGENIVKGAALEYDLASGRSRIIGGAATSESVEAGKGGRVKGRFVPESK